MSLPNDGGNQRGTGFVEDFPLEHEDLGSHLQTLYFQTSDAPTITTTPFIQEKVLYSRESVM